MAVAESGGKFSWPAFWAQYYCGVTALLQQRSGDAVACLELATAMMREGGIDPEVPIEIEYRQFLVVALRGAARRDEADALLKAVRTKIDKARADGWGHPQFQLIEAAQLALEGRAEDALTQLEDTLAQGPVSGRRGSWKGAWFLGIDPAFDSLRREPRFEALLSPQAQLQDPR